MQFDAILFIVHIQSNKKNRCSVCSLVGSWHGHSTHNYHVRTGAGHRFQQTVYVAGHLHHDQETDETETGCLQLPEPPFEGDMGERAFRLRRGEHSPICRFQILPVRVEVAPLHGRTQVGTTNYLSPFRFPLSSSFFLLSSFLSLLSSFFFLV